MKKILIIFQFTILVIMVSCNKGPGISDDNILKSNPEIKNAEALKEFRSVNALLDGYVSALNSLVKSGLPKNDHHLTFGKQVIESQYKMAAEYQSANDGFEPQKVDLKIEVSKLFDPENGFCTLPKKVMKSLKNLKKEGKSWAPAYVTSFVNELPDSAIYLSGRGVTVLLHSVEVRPVAGKNFSWILMGVPTFGDANIERFLATEGFNSFFYSLDGSGYLNAAIEASGAIPGADINACAKSALENKRSMFVSGGYLISPIAAAIYGNSAGTELDTIEKVKILRAIESIPGVLPADSVFVSSSYQAIWMSNEGSSSFNGSAVVKGEAGAGVGVASFSANSESGGTLSRKCSFTNYKTFFTNKKINPDTRPLTISEIRSLRESLENAN
jgi:hypothetical protein